METIVWESDNQQLYITSSFNDILSMTKVSSHDANGLLDRSIYKGAVDQLFHNLYPAASLRVPAV